MQIIQRAQINTMVQIRRCCLVFKLCKQFSMKQKITKSWPDCINQVCKLWILWWLWPTDFLAFLALAQFPQQFVERFSLVPPIRMSFALLYCMIAKEFLRCGDVFSHLFLLCSWNLMCRASDTDGIRLSHLEWHRAGWFYGQKSGRRIFLWDE